MTHKPETETVGYALFEETSAAYFYARVTFKLYNESADSLRNMGSESPLNDLTVSLAMSRTDSYCNVDLRYRDPYAVDLHRAQVMVKTLSGLQRKLDKFAAQFGNTDEYPEYLGRVFAALGVNRVIFAADLPRGSTWFSDHDGEIAQHFYTTSSARHRIAQWMETHRIRKVAA